MRRPGRPVVAALVVLALAPPVAAQYATVPESACSAAKIARVGRTANALLACHRKDAASRDACRARVGDGFVPAIAGRGPFERIEARHAPCLAGTTGNQAAYRSMLEAFADDVAAVLGVAGAPSACDRARLRCVATYVKTVLACVGKRADDGGGTVDAGCLEKAAIKFTSAGGAGVTSGCAEPARARSTPRRFGPAPTRSSRASRAISCREPRRAPLPAGTASSRPVRIATRFLGPSAARAGRASRATRARVRVRSRCGSRRTARIRRRCSTSGGAGRHIVRRSRTSSP